MSGLGTVLASDVGRGSEAFSKVKRPRGALSTLIDQSGGRSDVSQ